MGNSTRSFRTAFAIFALLALPMRAHAQLDEFGLACELAMGKAGQKLQTVQIKKHLACLKGASLGTLSGTADECITSSPNAKMLKVMEAFNKVDDSCPIPRPGFGYNSDDNASVSMFKYTNALMHDVFGADLDAGLVRCETDETACSCQQGVAKAVEKLVSLETKMFLSCHKNVLPTATSATEIGDCIDNPSNDKSLAADTKEKIGKQRDKIIDALTKGCSGVSLATAFGGDCASAPTAGDTGTCLAREASCRTCLIQRESNRLTDVDCDLFDDGSANASCVYEFSNAQRIDGFTVTCSNVVNTATYTECDDFLVEGRYLPNGVNCGPGWSTINSPYSDHAGLCQSLTGSPAFEAAYECGVTVPRWAWSAYNWSYFEDNGFTRSLRCYY